MPRTKGSKNKPKDQAMPTKTASTDVTVIDQPATKSVLVDMSNRYGMEPAAFEATVRATCMRPDKNGRVPTREEFAAFLLVAKEYNLNPLTKEIYAYAGKGGGIVPIVSVDGWVNLVNSHGACDGFDFDMEHGEKNALISATCRMYRKDRSHPVIVTEYLSECIRDTEPWKMKHRMLRHKSLIQAARYAFGFSGIYDEDEGAKIAEIEPTREGPPRAVPTSDPKMIEGTTNPPAGPPADPEQARDGTPPPRQAKAAPKEDPISTGGPPRTTAPKETGPTDAPVKPYRIPGDGHTFETWAAKYSDLIKTSPDVATCYGWIDANAKEFRIAEGAPLQKGPLARLSAGKPSIYADVKKTTERVMEKLRTEQEKVAEKAKKKAAPADPPSDMMDGPGDVHSDSDVPQNPEDILAAIDRELAAVEDADQLQECWDRTCDRLVDKLDFPPDKDAAQGLFQKHEKRLGGD